MSLIKKLKGTGVAVVTPFKNDFSIDFDAIKKLVDFLINNGIKYIVVQGTTGESSTMSNDEKIISREAFVKANNNRVPLVLGFSSNDTNYLLNDLNKTDFTGYSAILSVTPYYNKPTMNGLFNHFSLLAKSSTLPIILFHKPSFSCIRTLIPPRGPLFSLFPEPESFSILTEMELTCLGWRELRSMALTRISSKIFKRAGEYLRFFFENFVPLRIQ